eukprot:Selendium_serpulae@DN6343_c2_g1_i5.p1
MRLFRSMIMPKLLYGCETWTTTKPSGARLNTFHMKCLRTILGVTLLDQIPNTRIRERLVETSVGRQIQKKRLQWAGHVQRMPPERVQRQLLRSRASSGRRPAHGADKRWQDIVQEDLNATKLNLESATDRKAWRSKLHNLADTAEQ